MPTSSTGAQGRGGQPLRFFADRQRHLVCEPYSRAGLLRMADALGIGKHWLHTGRLMHVDIPQRSVQRVLADPRVQVVSARQVLAIIRGR